MKLITSGLKLFHKPFGSPEVITFFITNKCNAHCDFCIIKDELNTKTNELSVSEIESFVQKLSPISLMIITGGEPFLSTNLSALINELDKNKKVAHIAIPTNGSFPDKIESLLQNICLKNIKTLTISFSIDDAPELHNSERGVDQLWDKILECKNIIKKYQSVFNKKLLLHSSVIFNSKNQNRIEDIINLIDKNISPDSMGLTLIRKPSPEEYRKELDLIKYVQVNKKLSNNSSASNYLVIGNAIHAAKSQRIAIESESKFVSTCYAGLINIVIKPNGDVLICENINTVTGNLRDYDLNLSKLLKNKLHKKTTYKQINSHCVCGHECYVTPNIVFNPFQLSKTLIEYFL